jgi:hypothetical protein
MICLCIDEVRDEPAFRRLRQPSDVLQPSQILRLAGTGTSKGAALRNGVACGVPEPRTQESSGKTILAPLSLALIWGGAGGNSPFSGQFRVSARAARCRGRNTSAMIDA